MSERKKGSYLLFLPLINILLAAFYLFTEDLGEIFPTADNYKLMMLTGFIILNSTIVFSIRDILYPINSKRKS